MSETKRPRQRLEWASQEAYYAFLCKALPHDALCRSVDEAALRSRAANMRRRARGCVGGFGDIYILWNGITVWLEAKEAKGSLRDSQISFRGQVARNGGHYFSVRDMSGVESALRYAGIPLRATLGDIRARIAEQNERLPVKRKRSASPKPTPRFTASRSVMRRAGKGGILV